MDNGFQLRLQSEFDKLVSLKEQEETVINKSLKHDHYTYFLQESYRDEIYEFEIWGKTAIYKPVFKINNGKITSACNCKAGLENKECWHRLYIMSGKTQKLLNENAKEQLQQMILAYREAVEKQQNNTYEESNYQPFQPFKKVLQPVFALLITSLAEVGFSTIGNLFRN